MARGSTGMVKARDAGQSCQHHFLIESSNLVSAKQRHLLHDPNVILKCIGFVVLFHLCICFESGMRL